MFQWSNQIPPSALSCLHILFLPEMSDPEVEMMFQVDFQTKGPGLLKCFHKLDGVTADP